MHYKIKELHRLITTLKNEEGLSDYGVTLLEGYAVGLETVVKNCSIPAVVGRSEQLKAFADYAQKRVWEDGDKDLSEFVDEFLRL